MESLRGSEIVPVVMIGVLLAVWAAHQEARSQRHGRRRGMHNSQWKV